MPQKEVIARLGTLDLLDVAKEADFLTDFTSESSSVASREVIDRATLRRRLLLVLFALGTNIGIRQVVVTGEHGETEAALRHVRRHFRARGTTELPPGGDAELVEVAECVRVEDGGERVVVPAHELLSPAALVC